MAKVNVYNMQGKNVGEKKLDDAVFGVKAVPPLVHEVVTGMLANARKPFAHTKERGDVRGGGRKPWKQKGTGRARHGSIRSPLWSGGGVTFGPRKERNFGMKVNRKAKQQAFFMAFSDKVADDRLKLVEGLEFKDGKTSEVAYLLGKLKVEGRATFITSDTDKLLSRGSRNIQKVRAISVNDMGIMDVLGSDYLVMTPEATDKIESIYVKTKA